MSKNLPSSSGLMRSTLRDSVRRLKNIRKKAGKEDPDDKKAQSTGDPFRDKSNEFIEGLKKVKEMISERNTGMKKHGNDRDAIQQSNDIRRAKRALQVMLDEIKVMVGQSEQTFAKYNLKKSKKEEKLRLLERQYKERESQHRQCTEMLELVNKLDADRPDQQGGKRAGVNAGQELEVSKKLKLREQLNLKSLSTRAQQRAAAAAEGGTEMSETGKSQRLEDDPETKEHMKVLAQQEAQINAGLDRLKGNVARLHTLAVDIGSQLDMQNAMLDKTEETVDKQTKQLKGINRRLTKLLKTQSPMNMFINICCVFLILGLVGYFLLQFGVV